MILNGVILFFESNIDLIYTFSNNAYYASNFPAL